MHTIIFVPFSPEVIVKEGRYIFLTERRGRVSFDKRNTVTTTLKKVGDRMVHDIRNQEVLFRSHKPIEKF